MSFVVVSLVGIGETRRSLSSLGSPMLVTEAVRESRDEFVRLTKLRFTTGTSPDGSPWVPLKSTTLRVRRARGGQGSRPLVDSGALAASVRGDGRGNSVKVVVGGPDMFAGVHQTGNPSNVFFGGPSAPIPPRPFLPEDDVPEPYWDALIKPFDRRISEAFK